MDCENTTWNKGSPFDVRNFNVCISYKTSQESGVLFGDYRKIKELVAVADILVFFNAKYDLHWLRKLGIDFSNKRIWCCQLFEFLHGRMQKQYPSLEESCVQYDLGHKLDIIETEYWSKGVNTNDIPPEILSKYALQDVELTEKLFQTQLKIQRKHQRKLFNIQCQDLLVLEEMEWNGSFYNLEKSAEKAKELENQIQELQQGLNLYHNVPNFNWSSNDHLSALLFGGTIEETIKVPNGFYKTGQKKGQIKFSNQLQTYVLPRKYKPVPKTELAKGGVWSVEEDHLLQLKGDKTLIHGILKIKELEKLNNTYFKKYPKLHAEQHWRPGFIFASFNQVTTRTGRLSSTRPNIQNIAEPALELFESR